MTTSLHALLVEDNPGDVFILRHMLREIITTHIQLTHVDSLCDAVDHLKQQQTLHPKQPTQHPPIDAILLDLSLPDTQGLKTLQALHQPFPHCPIVVLTGLDDEALAIQAVKQGAQDYLVKGQVTADLLFRSLCYAIERNKIEQTITQQKRELEQANRSLKDRTEELEQTNQKLRQRTSQLEAANAELDAFNDAVSHDLRNPLTVIGGCTDLLELFYADGLDERGTSCLQQLRTTTNHMTHLVEDLLQLSRTDGGELRMQTVDLSAIAHDIIVQLQQQSPDHQVEVKITRDLIVTGEPDLLWVVLENLLTNAWKYTQKQDCPVIEFGTMPLNEVSPHLHDQFLQATSALGSTLPTPFISSSPSTATSLYYVKDNGVGFDMDNAHNLFTPFQRLHSKHEFEGTGLGLATVKRIIRRHNGMIGAIASINQGATFFFTLPNLSLAESS